MTYQERPLYKKMKNIFMIKSLVLIFLTKATETERPVIGILMGKSKFGEDRLQGEYFVTTSHVAFLQSAGCRVIPIKSYGNKKYYTDILSKVNGVYFPGGLEMKSGSKYEKAMIVIFKLVKRMNDEGTYFPLWATCLGLHKMITIVAGSPILQRSNEKHNRGESLNLTTYANTSKLFGVAPQSIVNILQTENVAPYNFNFFATLNDFIQNKELYNFFNILSTVSHEGTTVVSTIEAKRYPIYGVLWHPEKHQKHLHQPTISGFTYTENGILVAQYVANFIASEARKNNHHFQDKEELMSLVMENYCPVMHGPPYYRQLFYFNRTTSTRRCTGRTNTMSNLDDIYISGWRNMLFLLIFTAIGFIIGSLRRCYYCKLRRRNCGFIIPV